MGPRAALTGRAWRLLRGLTAALGVGALVGAGPAPEGTEVVVGAAYGRYTTPASGCGSLARRYRVVEPAVDAAVRHRFDSGAVVQAAGSVAPGAPTVVGPTGPDTDPDTTYLWSGGASVQGGFHGGWAGIQAGPALTSRPEYDRLRVLPSAEIWVGRPHIAYVWSTLLAQPHTGAMELAALAGLGHRSDRVHLEVGTSGAGWLGRAGVRAGDGVWMHAELAGGALGTDVEQVDLRGRVAFTVLPGALAAAGADAPRR